jgi:hypothetical protein
MHIQIHRLTGEIYEVCRWDGLRCHDIHTKFHKDWFRHSKIDRADTQTQTSWWSHEPFFFQNHKISVPILLVSYRGPNTGYPKVSRNFFWNIMRCSLLKVNRRFGGTYRLHLQGRKISWARNQRATYFHADFLLLLFFNPEYADDISSKRRLTFRRLHGIISQKIVLVITTAVRTSWVLCHRVWRLGVANVDADMLLRSLWMLHSHSFHLTFIFILCDEQYFIIFII